MTAILDNQLCTSYEVHRKAKHSRGVWFVVVDEIESPDTALTIKVRREREDSTETYRVVRVVREIVE